MKDGWKKNTALFLTSQTLSLFGTMLVQYAIMWHIVLETQSDLFNRNGLGRYRGIDHFVWAVVKFHSLSFVYGALRDTPALFQCFEHDLITGESGAELFRAGNVRFYHARKHRNAIWNVVFWTARRYYQH